VIGSDGVAHVEACVVDRFTCEMCYHVIVRLQAQRKKSS